MDYDNYEDMKNDFIKGRLHPLDLKNAVADFLIELLQPIREKFTSPEMKELLNRAYPENV